MDIILYLVFFMDLRKNTNDIFYFISKKILQNINEIPDMGIERLAELCYTSPATISRFCKHISLKNYVQLKVEITHTLKQYGNSQQVIMEQLAKKTSKKIAMQTFGDDIKSLKSTYRSIDFTIFDQVIDILQTSHYISVFGNAYSQLAARDFQYKFLRVNKFVTAFTDHNDQISEVKSMPSDGVALFFSISGKQNFNNELVTLLKNRNITIIALTHSKSSFLGEAADIVIEAFDETAQTEQQSNSLYGRISLMALVDLLFNLYIVRNNK